MTSWRQLDCTKAGWRRGRTRDCRETTSPSGQCYTWTCDLWITESVPQPLVNAASWWDFVSVSGCLCVQIAVRLSASRSQTTTLTNFVAHKAVSFAALKHFQKPLPTFFVDVLKTPMLRVWNVFFFLFRNVTCGVGIFIPNNKDTKTRGFE